MAYESLASWKELERNRARLFLNTGVLWISKPGSGESLESAGVRFKHLTGAQIADLYPQVRFTSEVDGFLEPESGVLLAESAVLHVINAAEALGVKIAHDTVVGPVSNGDIVSTASGATLNAGAYIYACGAWLGKLFPTILGRLITPTRQPLFFFEPPRGDARFDASHFPAWIDDTDCKIAYGIPDLGHGFKVGFHRLGRAFDPDRDDDRNVTGAEVAECREYLAQRFPVLADAPLTSARVCQYENTPTGDFIIDRHPEFQNVWIVGGGSGHGFKHGPAVADYLVQRFDGKIPDEATFLLKNHRAGSGRSVI